MKAAPVSTDLLIKLAIGAAALGAVYYAYRQASNGISSIGDSISTTLKNAAQAVIDAPGLAYDATVAKLPDVVASVNPADEQNLIYRASNAMLDWTGSLGASNSPNQTVGTRLYDMLHIFGK